MFDDSVMSKFQAAGVDAMKGPPSATHRHQAWDCGPLFRGIKQGVDRIISASMPFENDTLQLNLENYMKHFDEAFSSIQLTSTFKNKIIDCLQTICWSAKTHWTAPKMTDSFVVVGQHVLGALKTGTPTVDYTKIMQRSYCEDITDKDLDHMANMMPQVVEKYQQEGIL